MTYDARGFYQNDERKFCALQTMIRHRQSGGWTAWLGFALTMVVALPAWLVVLDALSLWLTGRRFFQ